MDGTKGEVLVRGGGKGSSYEALGGGSKVYIGLDIGSTSSDLVVLDKSLKVIYSDYRRTLGRPFETAAEQLEGIEEQFKGRQIEIFAATGTAGRYFAKLGGAAFVNEVAAQAAAVRQLYPQISRGTIIEMGGQDSKLIFLATESGRRVIKDFALNTVCAAGTGSFLDQQAARLGINIEEEFGRLAAQCQNPPRIAGRCSVFAKSDMIHLQQLATPMSDILAGLCVGLARNLKSNLGCGREFVKPIVFTGGVAANLGVVKAIRQVFELGEEELIVPKEHFFTGAIGAVLAARAAGNYKEGKSLSEIIKSVKSEKIQWHAAARKPLARPRLAPPKSPVFSSELSREKKTPAFLGVDVGSISTNVVVMDEKKRVLAKSYVMTAGKPLEAVQAGLREVEPLVAGKVEILGAATTGSGRYLTGDFIGADVIVNEITAQAAGAAIVNPTVDTIFEIGGQDSKYISLHNGVVVDFEMNHACAAGTGSFLEEQAQRLGISIKEEFANLAFESKGPVKLGERCTVFMESDLLNHQQQGAKTSDLVAGLSYSIVSNYLNRVVGQRKIGNNICFQGGTAFNKAVWAAFEMVVGKPVMVPDHHEVTGALGAANIAAEYMKAEGQGQASRFKGFENLARVEYTVESFTCEYCANNCEIKQVMLKDSEPLFYGSRCDRYNLKKSEKKKEGGEDLFEFRQKKLLEYAGVSAADKHKLGQTVGIPLALGNWQMLPLFSRFIKELGLNVELSPQTTKSIIRTGVETVSAQTCFPVKVMHGHAEYLLKKQLDYILIPSIVSLPSIYEGNRHNHLCPYVQTIPYQVRTAFESRMGRTRMLTPIIRLGDGKGEMLKSFAALAKSMGKGKAAARRALEAALKAQEGFEQCLRDKGREVLSKLKEHEKMFIMVSRPYNGCDAGVNLELPKKLAGLNARIMPMDMLDFAGVKVFEKDFHSKIYWRYGQNILRAAEIIRNDPRLYGIYLSNFSCGPDSFLMTFFKQIMGSKPVLQLELDEHSADAGAITRLEAFFESLKNYRAQESEEQRPILKAGASGTQRTIHIPYMGDSSYGIAAAFRAHGQCAEVMPIADEAALIEGRRFTTGKECLPCAITSGDMLKVLSNPNTDPSKVAFFMPGGIGPCRFGMYNCLHQLILEQAGYKDVVVLAPNQDVNFYHELTKVSEGLSFKGFTKYAWIASVGIDLMKKAILKIRPYAHEPRIAQGRYDEAMKIWVSAIERKEEFKKLVSVMDDIAQILNSISLDRTAVRPTIGIVGEIYVRSHEFANQHIISQLESLGAACEPASLAEWIYYTNMCRRSLSWRRGRYQEFLRNEVENFFQRRLEKDLARPLERYFGELAEEPLEHVLDLARPYVDSSFEGEAVLSIGKMVEFHHKGMGGVINVMPFTCMPSTIVSTQTMRISRDCENMPILNLSFDGQSDPTLTTRLEAFVEQIRQRRVGVSRVNVPAKEHAAV